MKMNKFHAWAQAFALACCCLFAAGQAQAHAHPKAMMPAEDAVIAAPAAISITFTEALEGAFSALTVVDSTGHAVATGKAELDEATRSTLRLAVPALSPGLYTVKWVAVSRDGHRTNGSYNFTVK